MKVRAIRTKDVEAAYLLISRTYHQFNRNEGTAEATQEYVQSYTPSTVTKDMIERFKRTPICFVAEDENEIVGVIRGIPGRVVNLFVNGTCHRKGIGSKLLKRFESHCTEENIELIKIKSSLYAVPFYQHHGYKKTTGIRNFRDLKVQPMSKRLTSGLS